MIWLMARLSFSSYFQVILITFSYFHHQGGKNTTRMLDTQYATLSEVKNASLLRDNYIKHIRRCKFLFQWFLILVGPQIASYGTGGDQTILRPIRTISAQ